MAVAYKGGKCENCGYNKCLGAMDFHHLDPNKKDFSISSEGHIRSWALTKIEIDKCILLCRNCHSETHYAEYAAVRLKKIDSLEINLEHKEPCQTATNCAQCNLPMRVFNSRLKRSKVVFCDLECKRLYFSKYVWPSDSELLTKANMFGTKSLIKQLNLPKSVVYKKLAKIRADNNYERQYKRKVERPSKELLNELLWKIPTTKIAKQYNVSGKAVEKWAKKYGLKKPSRGYWSKQPKC